MNGGWLAQAWLHDRARASEYDHGTSAWMAKYAPRQVLLLYRVLGGPGLQCTASTASRRLSGDQGLSGLFRAGASLQMMQPR